MSFWDLLRGPPPNAKNAAKAKPPTVDELREALRQAEAEAEAAELIAAEAAQARAAQLVVASDEELDELDRRLRLAERAADRSAAAATELKRRLDEAERQQRQDELDQIFSRGAEAEAKGVAAFKAYGELARQIVPYAEQMRDSAEIMEQVNRQLKAAGDPRSFRQLGWTTRPKISDGELLRVELWDALKLPHDERPEDYFWPPFTQLVVKYPPSTPGGGPAPPPPPLPPGVARW